MPRKRTKHSAARQAEPSTSSLAQPPPDDGDESFSPAALNRTVITGRNINGADGNKIPYKESRQTTVASGIGANVDGDTDGGDYDEDEEETQEGGNDLTFGERLHRLKLNEASTAATGSAVATGSRDKPTTATLTTRNYAGGMTLTNQLIQALHTSDSVLLEGCLDQRDLRLVRATVKRLPQEWVLPLVDALVERLSRSRKGAAPGKSAASAQQAKSLIVWLRAALIAHIGYLITVPFLVNRLAGLYRTLEARLAMHDRYLALSGRLDVVVAQIDSKLQDQELLEEANVPQSSKKGPRVYEEGDEDDEDEDERIQSPAKPRRRGKRRKGKILDDGDKDDGMDDEDIDGLVNGNLSSDDDDDEGSVEDVALEPDMDGEDLLDMEAEEGTAESGEGEDEDENEQGDDDEEDEDEDDEDLYDESDDSFVVGDDVHD